MTRFYCLPLIFAAFIVNKFNEFIRIIKVHKVKIRVKQVKKKIKECIRSSLNVQNKIGNISHLPFLFQFFYLLLLYLHLCFMCKKQ